MVDEYTPNVGEVRWGYSHARQRHGRPVSQRMREFDRWLAGERATAIEQAANRITGLAWPPIREQLDVYAQQVREGDAVRQWGSD